VAEKKHPKAQYRVALMYEVGSGVRQDDEEALKWYLESYQNEWKEYSTVKINHLYTLFKKKSNAFFEN